MYATPKLASFSRSPVTPLAPRLIFVCAKYVRQSRVRTQRAAPLAQRAPQTQQGRAHNANALEEVFKNGRRVELHRIGGKVEAEVALLARALVARALDEADSAARVRGGGHKTATRRGQASVDVHSPSSKCAPHAKGLARSMQRSGRGGCATHLQAIFAARRVKSRGKRPPALASVCLAGSIPARAF